MLILYLFSIGLAIQQDHENCCIPVLLHRLYFLFIKLPSIGIFDSVLTRTIETQHCQVFQSHFLLIFVFCWICLPKLWNTSLYFWSKSKSYWVGLHTFWKHIYYIGLFRCLWVLYTFHLMLLLKVSFSTSWYQLHSEAKEKIFTLT